MAGVTEQMRCARCGDAKPVSAFSFHRQSGRYRTHCKECRVEESRAYAAAHAQERSLYQRAYKESNRERLRLYRETRREDTKAYNKAYRSARREEMRAYYRAYDAANKDRRRSAARERNKRRMAVDVRFRLKARLRSRLAGALRAGIDSGGKRGASAVRHLGCSVADLMAYLERQFRPGMSWDTYGIGVGRWNIDHIRPLASFDLTDSEQAKVACNFTNLQPLWHVENVRKGSRMPAQKGAR